jgi:hypothetical protein
VIGHAAFPADGDDAGELLAKAAAAAHAASPGTAGSPGWRTELSSEADPESTALRPLRSTKRSS